MTITPHANEEEWTVIADWDASACSAMVNFSVPGKPDPPPVPLMMSYYEATGGQGQPTGLPILIFTDPSKTIANESNAPVNTWVRAAL